MNLLAAIFSHPLLLIGLLGAGIPALIEWLFRRRRREVTLPTLRYLLNQTDVQKFKRQDRLLLILRTVFCFFVALAVARPVLRSEHLSLGAQPHIVLLLDNTASMSQSVGVTTAFGEAKKKAAELVRQLPAGTAVSVITLSQQAEVVVENSKEGLASANKIAALQPGEGDAPIAAGLAKVKEVLDRAGGGEIYILTDLQKHTWLRDSAEAANAGGLMRDLSSRYPVYLADCAQEIEFNDAVVRLGPRTPIMARGIPVTFTADIRRFGVAPSDAIVTASFLVDGIKKASHPVTGSGTLEFPYSFPDAGEHLVEIDLEGDRFKLDNHRAFLASVPDAHKILILDATAGRSGLGRGSFFLDRAITPPVKAGFERVTPFETKVVLPERAAYENFNHYAAVVLTGCEAPDEALVSKLNVYANNGAAVWFFLGPEENNYEYNRRLYRDGAGLLPCKISGPVSDTRELFIAGALQEPAIPEALRAISGYVPLELKDSATAVTLATLGAPGAKESKRTPAFVLSRVGQGHVAIASIPPSLVWSKLPASIDFPLLVQAWLELLIDQPDAAVNLQISDAFEQPVFVSAQHLLLRLPDGRFTRLTPEQNSNGWRARYAPSVHGLYEVQTMAEVMPRRRFVANLSASESDLSKASNAELSSALGGGWTLYGPREAWIEAAGQRHSMLEFAPAILWALATVLAVESFLASRFGRRRAVQSAAKGTRP